MTQYEVKIKNTVDTDTIIVDAENKREVLRIVAKQYMYMGIAKRIKIKELKEPTGEDYENMKELAMWGWVLAVAILIMSVIFI